MSLPPSAGPTPRDGAALRLLVSGDLLLFLPAHRRRRDLEVGHDGTATLGHVVQSVGIPLPEVGRLLVADEPVTPEATPRAGDVVTVEAVRRPVLPPGSCQRLLLDVHHGSLARQLRLLGIDTAYDPRLDDETLAQAAVHDDRVLLTKDRALLMRRQLRDRSGYVRGDGAQAQLADILDRYAPPLRPWTRCPACNGGLVRADKRDVAPALEPGTVRSYDAFRRCGGCGRVYWRGAHAARLEAIVESARRSSS